jgi:hypothetical protein
MNTLEQFIAVYEPQGDKNVGFREMLEKVIQEIKNKTQPTNEVISMRDYFAAKAMQGLIGINLSHLQEKHDLKKSEMIAVLAYHYADAMMLARKVEI